MNQTPRRVTWNGTPVELQELWILTKGSKVARCSLHSHELGWELKLESGPMLQTQVCRSDAQIEKFQAEWKAAMIERGWR